jgi:hypothetical protein
LQTDQPVTTSRSVRNTSRQLATSAILVIIVIVIIVVLSGFLA